MDGTGSNHGPHYEPVQTFLVEGCEIPLSHTENTLFIYNPKKWKEYECGRAKVNLLGKTMSFGVPAYLVSFFFTDLRGQGAGVSKKNKYSFETAQPHTA